MSKKAPADGECRENMCLKSIKKAIKAFFFLKIK